MICPRNIHGVLFDLDGTLLDTLGDISTALDRAVRAAGYPGHTLPEYRAMIGEGARTLVRKALRPPGEAEGSASESSSPKSSEPKSSESKHSAPPDAEIERVLRMFRREYWDCCLKTTRPYPGVSALLSGLAAAGVPLGVLSNKPHDMTVAVTSAFLGHIPFRVVLGAREGVPRKPHPAAAVEACAALWASPRDVLFVGDSLVDARTAHAAGMCPVGVRWGFRPPAELIAANVHGPLHHPFDLIPLLRSRGIYFGHWLP